MKSNNYAIILASGTGVRLWPMSTIKKPKQFHDLLGVGKTFVQLTYERLLKLIPATNIYFTTTPEYIPLLKEQISDLTDENIICEPRIMNTAACNMLAAMTIYKKDPLAKLIISPSDHFIVNEDEFRDKINLGLDNADDDKLITLGVAPTRPDPNYSYIQMIENHTPIKKVKTFVDKPDVEFAESFLQSGDFIWNSGIMIWSAKSILKAFKKLTPTMFETLYQYFELDKQNDETLKPIYTTLDVASINKAILERADNVYVIPTTLGWSDIGTWESINKGYELADNGKDKAMNVVKAKLFRGYEAHNNFIHSTTDRAIVVDGLDNFMVIDSPNGLLICPRGKAREIKTYVSDLKLNKGEKYC